LVTNIGHPELRSHFNQTLPPLLYQVIAYCLWTPSDLLTPPTCEERVKGSGSLGKRKQEKPGRRKKEKQLRSTHRNPDARSQQEYCNWRAWLRVAFDRSSSLFISNCKSRSFLYPLSQAASHPPPLAQTIAIRKYRDHPSYPGHNFSFSNWKGPPATAPASIFREDHERAGLGIQIQSIPLTSLARN